MEKMEKKKILIAFTGRKRSGKDTSAGIWKELQGKEKSALGLEFAFASILKDIADRSLGINSFETDALKELNSAKIANIYSYREYLNTLGDAIKSYFGIDVWARLTIERLDDINSHLNLDSIIITDLRYPIEQEYLKAFAKDNGFMFRTVKLRNLNQTQRVENIKYQEHESEYLVDEIQEDYLIEAQSLEELKEKITEVYNEVIELAEGELDERSETTTPTES